MDQLLKKHKLAKFTRYETDHLNSNVTIKQTKFVILKRPKKQSSGPNGKLKKN